MAVKVIQENSFAKNKFSRQDDKFKLNKNKFNEQKMATERSEREEEDDDKKRVNLIITSGKIVLWPMKSVGSVKHKNISKRNALLRKTRVSRIHRSRFDS